MQPTRQAAPFPEMHDSPIDEVSELVSTLLATPPHRLTACRGWTTHELVAHLAAGAAEEADLIAEHLAGAPSRPTRAFEARELPYRALPDSKLRDELIAQAGRLGVALDRLAAGDGPDRVAFTGRLMTAADFAMHSRSECALHRWDIVGRDDAGWEMLGQPDLTKHALTVLTAMSTLPETPANRLRTRSKSGAAPLVLRSEPHDDVVIRAGDGEVTLTLEPIDERRPDVELDPAARLLLLWGRREPSAPIELHSEGADSGSRAMLEELLGW